MTVASYSYGENPRYDKMNYAEVRNELDKRDELIHDMWWELSCLDLGLDTAPMMQRDMERRKIRERYEALGLGE